MKTISTALKTHIAGEQTTLATCWKITRRDATVMGFTDHDKDINFESVNYLARTGISPSSVSSSATLAVDNLDIEGVIDASVIKEEDILAGKYDYAEIEIFILNYEDLTQGRLWLRRGWIGEVSMNRGQFVAEVRGLTQLLAQVIGELYSPSCRAKLGDTRCQVALASFTVTGTVTASEDTKSFEDSSRDEEAGYFNAGVVTFTSGNNQGISIEVREYSPGVVKLVLPLTHAIEVGDTYQMIAGCDKTFETCKEKFNNVLNFRGEPHVPGTDKMLETASTRSGS